MRPVGRASKVPGSFCGLDAEWEEDGEGSKAGKLGADGESPSPIP